MINTDGERRDSDLGSDDGLRGTALTYGPELRAYATRKLGSRSLAEDLVQETFLPRVASRRPLRCDTRDDSAWLFAILRNLIIDFARTQARRMTMSPVTSDATTSDDSDAVVGSLVLHDAFRQLVRSTVKSSTTDTFASALTKRSHNCSGHRSAPSTAGSSMPAKRSDTRSRTPDSRHRRQIQTTERPSTLRDVSEFSSPACLQR